MNARLLRVLIGATVTVILVDTVAVGAQAPCPVDTLWRMAEESDAAIARAVPEYAGAYADTTALTIFVTSLEAGVRAEHATRVELTRRFGVYSFDAAQFRVMKYSYRQLQSWYECVFTAAQHDIYLSFLAMSANQVWLHVRSAAARARVESVVRALQIPDGAVRVAIGEPR